MRFLVDNQLPPLLACWLRNRDLFFGLFSTYNPLVAGSHPAGLVVRAVFSVEDSPANGGSAVNRPGSWTRMSPPRPQPPAS